MISNPKSQGGNGGSYVPKTNCKKCGKKHNGKCIFDIDGCISCGKVGHKMIYCPILKFKGREDKRAPSSDSNTNAQKQNNFYAFQS